MIDPFGLLLGVLLQFWWLWLFLLATSLLGAVFKSPAFKGWLGEAMLNMQLGRLPTAHYHLIPNLTLPTSDGSTQIDHVVVSRYGIFVIETKNYSGWIFGKASDRLWTQQIHRRRSSFQNPLRQNYKHLRTLAELVDVDDRALFSLIVFVGKATFKTPMPANVVQFDACLPAIQQKTAVLLDDDAVARVLARIAAKRLAPTMRTHRAHVRHVKETVGARVRPAAVAPVEKPAPEPIPLPVPACPLCSGALDTLHYKTGPKLGLSFQGCTRFPSCDYRVDLPLAA